jgi:predicted metal-dependent phosphoesterase TrpH/glycosyltransferase involved in cell wall biosynthesis
VALRICLVTPFAWSQPHDVNEHVAGVAQELRELGHLVTILASSNRAADLAAGRRALHDGVPEGGLIALGPAVRVSRRSRVGVPVGVRTNLGIALERGRFDVVHGFEPALPSLSYVALRDADSLSVATFLSAERVAYPRARAQRERLLGRIDALIATSEETARVAAERFPGSYRVIPEGVDTSLFEPIAKRRTIVLEWLPTERPLARAVLHALDELPDWRLVLLRTKPLTGRPYVPRRLASRVEVRTARDGPSRAHLLNDAAIFVPSPEGLPRVRLEASAAGCAIAAPAGTDKQPPLAAAEMGRLADDEAYREQRAREARETAERQTFATVAAELEQLYESLRGRRRTSRLSTADPLADRDWIVVDLHTHTSASHDCGVPPALLLEHAVSEGLGALAVTDHNTFAGAQEAVDLARDGDFVVIPGEEIKTDGQGEVIGLFLEREIPRGMSFGETIAAIKEQDGIVYVPHPFDRMHAIPDPATLHRHLAGIDVFEVYNARLLFEAYNDEALRFARKYNLTMGAGSDAHVLQGLGTGALRMRRFDDREEFLLSLRSAEILRRPKSLLYLQSLKWAAQAKERVR